MSGYPGSGADPGALNSLLAQLRGQQSAGDKPISLEPSYGYYNNQQSNYYAQQSPSQQVSPGYQQPSVSSPLPTPPTHSQPPHHSSAIMSPVENTQPASAPRTSNLLNLLKFSQPSVSSPKQAPPVGIPLPPSRESSMGYSTPEASAHTNTSAHNRNESNLLATLMGSIQAKPTERPSPKVGTASQASQFSSTGAETIPSDDSQKYLLGLLNQPKPAQADTFTQFRGGNINKPPSKESSRDEVGGLLQALEDTSIDMSLMGSAATEGRLLSSLGQERETTPKHPAQGLFTYVNPFEQLAASSPRNRTPKTATPGASLGPSASAIPSIQILKRQSENSDNKRKIDIDKHSSTQSPAYSKRKTDAQSQVSSGPPTPLPDGRTQLEALIGIGAPNHKETVSDALNEVGDQVDKQVQEALARVEQDDNQATIEKDMENMLDAKTEEEFEEAAQIAAIAIKEELEQDRNIGALDSLPLPVAEAVKEIIEDTAQGHIADSWESADAEDSPVKEDEENVVKVYNFPMKPWTSVYIKGTEEPRSTFRDEIVMDIARLKKEFDQVDRTLVTASNNFIVYGMSKNGGIRIIRQDDGKDTRLFTETHDRIFNVVTSSSAADQKEAVLGIGITGTIYWALIKDGQGDHIEDSHPELYGFALPAIPALDSESPGGVLKTRARKSSNHPDYFAVGRGKSINIIWPSLVMKSYLKHGKDRTVDVEKYLSQHSLKVNIGKAGKDFTFSEDDTTIASLDKAGRVKFWDVRQLTEIDSHGKPAAQNTPFVEVKEPLVTFHTTNATDKAWPTSVLFVDKLRPYQRGGALRYLIVGMKQNHTLQLWDLGLGKPVQEIHLPHSKESDAICSVMYHAATGMVVVGHPTRNSIYFLHLSAPKYNLPKTVNQAMFMQNLTTPDPSIPKPDSTAVISGMREYSFANKGALRSLDILQTPSSATAGPDDPPTLFELYAMHSKGVTCLSIKQADLGWTSDNKVLQPVEAAKAGLISIHTLKEISPVIPGDISTTPLTVLPHRIAPRPTSKEATPRDASKRANQAEASTPTASSKTEDKAEKKDHHNGASGAEKFEKKKRKKATSSSAEARAPTPTSAPQTAPQQAQSSKATVLDPFSNARNGAASKATLTTTPEVESAIQNSAFEQRIVGEVKKHFGDSFDALFRNIHDDRRARDSLFGVQSEAMLRLVSSTLTDNVQQSLDSIVTRNITEAILPAVSEITQKAINEEVGPKLNAHLSNNLPKELQKVLPDAIGRALQRPQLLKLMADSLASSVSFHVEEQFANTLSNTVVPAFQALATQTAQRIAVDVQREAEEQIGNLERQAHADSIKIDQLVQLVTGLSEMVSTMAGAQEEFQSHLLKLQTQLGERDDQATASAAAASTAVMTTSDKSPKQSQYDNYVDAIVTSLNEGNFQEAILIWLKSGMHQQIFETLLVKYNPAFIRELDPIYLIAVGSVICDRLEGEALMQRLAWLDTVLQTLKSQTTNVDDQELGEQIIKIVGTYVQKFEHLFMLISQQHPGDALLKRISLMSSIATQIISSVQEPVLSPQSMYKTQQGQQHRWNS